LQAVEEITDFETSECMDSVKLSVVIR